jgi:hypothetical protein
MANDMERRINPVIGIQIGHNMPRAQKQASVKTHPIINSAIPVTPVNPIFLYNIVFCLCKQSVVIVAGLFLAA